MDTAVLEVLLWSRQQPDAPPRVVEFKRGMVNVVSGTSRKGKSALTWIIDYCLGSERCAIPVDVVRDNVSWYGVRLLLGAEQWLVCREAPDHTNSTSRASVHFDVAPGSTPTPQPTDDIEQAKRALSARAGLSRLGIEPASADSRFDGALSIRDMVSFNFLPQHIVANPNALFYKADSHTHRERLRRAIPYALGTMDLETLRLEHELAEAHLAVGRLERRHAVLGKAYETWQGQLRGLVGRAAELGLLHDVPLDMPPGEAKAVLADLAGRLGRSSDVLAATCGPPTDDRLQQVVDREGDLCRQLSDARREQAQMTRLGRAAGELEPQLEEARRCLRLAGWFQGKVAPGYRCPCCGQKDQAYRDIVGPLMTQHHDVNRLLDRVHGWQPALDKDERVLRLRIEELQEELKQIREQRRYLEATTPEAAQYREQEAEVFRFLGRVDEVVETTSIVESGSIVAELDEAKARRDDLQVRLEVASAPKGSEKRALATVGKLIAEYAKHLLVRGPDQIELDKADLTLRLTEGRRKDWLYELGSAANHMGYHLATLLALHEVFISNTNSPVPTFLVIDQPTQAYFPRHPMPDEPAGDEDSAGVQAIFSTLQWFMERTDHRVQVIVTEHAPEVWWRGCPSVDLVADWHGDDALIPAAWLTD